MADKNSVLTPGAAKVFKEMAAAHRQRLPAVGRRTRRVWSPGSGGDDIDRQTRCCGDGCADRKVLTIFGNFADQYTATNLPASLDGPVTLDYIGLSSGLTGITNDFPYWESDTFNFTCDAGTDTYYWRMVIGASSPCRVGGGQSNVFLYLVSDSSALNCDFTEWNCASITESPVVQYKNIHYYRARCGSTLHLYNPNALQDELDDILPCTVCVEPVNPQSYFTPTDACLISLNNQFSPVRTTWPTIIFAEVTSSTISGWAGLRFALSNGGVSGANWTCTTDLSYVYGNPNGTNESTILIDPCSSSPSCDFGFQGGVNAQGSFVNTGVYTVGSAIGCFSNTVCLSSRTHVNPFNVTITMDLVQITGVGPCTVSVVRGSVTWRFSE